MTDAGLPDRLSALLRLAVADAQKCEQDPRYRLDMDEWHDPDFDVDGKCGVCMAGAVMAKTLGVPFDRVVTPSTLFDSDSKMKLLAINQARVGNLRNALSFLGADLDLVPDLADLQESIRSSRVSGRAPWEKYLEVADKLEILGL